MAIGDQGATINEVCRMGAMGHDCYHPCHTVLLVIIAMYLFFTQKDVFVMGKQLLSLFPPVSSIVAFVTGKQLLPRLSVSSIVAVYIELLIVDNTRFQHSELFCEPELGFCNASSSH